LTNSKPTDLYQVAARLDESPEELLNGGAAEALRALNAVSPEVVASQRGIAVIEVKALWDRAGARLGQTPGPDELYPAAAEAATLLYGAAWVANSDAATVDDVRAII
jgi:hypothetical protein